MNASDLGPDLRLVPDRPGHGTIQPSRPMPLKDYQRALERTQNSWEKVSCP